MERSGKYDVILAAVAAQLPELDPAELYRVMDYIREIKLARKYRNNPNKGLTIEQMFDIIRT